MGGAGSHSAFAQSNGVLVNLNGGATDAEDIIRYEPFGDFRGNARPDDITDHSLQTTFTGHEDNMDIGLVYMKARYYLPGVGRFVSADNIIPEFSNPQSRNRYSYAVNNPLKFSDPTGHYYIIEQDEGDIYLTDNEYGEAIIAMQSDVFVNPIEVAIANFMLTGDAKYLDLVDKQIDQNYHYGLLWPFNYVAGQIFPGEGALDAAMFADPFLAYGIAATLGAPIGDEIDNMVHSVIRYGQRLVRGSGLQKHHGIMDVWANTNIAGYDSRQAPAIVLTESQHNATRRVFNQWRQDRTGSVTGQIDWTQVSSEEMVQLSESMFNAAGVPLDARVTYYESFSNYVRGLGN